MSTPPIPPTTPWWHPTWRRLLGLSVAFFLIVLAFMGGRLVAGDDPGLKDGGDQAAQRSSGGDGDSGADGGLGIVDRVLSTVTGEESDADEGSSSGDESPGDGYSTGGDAAPQSADPNPPTTQAS